MMMMTRTAFHQVRGFDATVLDLTAVRMVAAGDGRVLGVAAVDLNFGVLNDFLTAARSTLFSALGNLSTTGTEHNISLLILDEEGRIYATTTDDATVAFVDGQPVQVISPRPCSLIPSLSPNHPLSLPLYFSLPLPASLTPSLSYLPPSLPPSLPPPSLHPSIPP